MRRPTLHEQMSQGAGWQEECREPKGGTTTSPGASPDTVHFRPDDAQPMLSLWCRTSLPGSDPDAGVLDLIGIPADSMCAEVSADFFRREGISSFSVLADIIANIESQAALIQKVGAREHAGIATISLLGRSVLDAQVLMELSWTGHGKSSRAARDNCRKPTELDQGVS